MQKADHPFDELKKEYAKLRRILPRLTAELAINHFKENWRRQGYYNAGGQLVKWKKRKHDKGSRAILVGKGRSILKKKFHNRSANTYVKVVNDSPYGRVHNEGLPIKGQKLVQAGFTKTGRPRWKRSGTPAKMPKRTFMNHNRKLMGEIDDMYMKELDRIGF